MTVRLVSQTEEHPTERQRLLLHNVQELQPEREVPQPPRPNPPHREDLIELMGTIARILGFRLHLFLAFLGAAGIGGYAVYKGTPMALTAFGLYALLIFLPMLFSAHKRG